MAVNIAGVIVIGVLILVLGILAGTSVVATTTIGFSAFKSNDLEGEQARTKLEFVSAAGGSGDLTLKIKNTGLTSVFNFTEMDLIVEYIDASDNQISTYLTYTTGVLANNEWKKISISPDTNQPEAWNPNETITLDALLSPTQKADSTAIVKVVTPNGATVTWTLGPSGFFWFSNALDISLITALSWQDIDLTDEVPEGATGAIVEVINTGTSGDLSGVVRGKEDTRDYMSNTKFEEIEDETHRWQIVKVDSNRVIQGYVEDTQVDFKLLGYTMGTDPVYFNTPLDVTPTTKQVWTPTDVSAFVDADADGVILFISSEHKDPKKYAVREIGSSFSNTGLKLFDYSNSMYFVGIDSANQFDVWVEELDIKIYLVAQTKGSVVYYVNDLAVTDPATGSFEAIDADTYSVPAVANGLILSIEESGGTDRIANVRHGDSTDAWTPDVGSDTHIQAAIGINDDNVWDEYIEDGDIDVSIAAYTRTIAN
jgi:hypothetical protein